MKKRLRIAAVSSVWFIVFAALAATLYPFIIATYFPGVTFQIDSMESYRYASTVPRLVMQTSVQRIKKGDIVRVTYADGAIYDYETTSQCSYVASISCALMNPELKTSPAAPAKPSQNQLAEARMFARDSCSKSGIWVDIPTGYWSEKFDFSGGGALPDVVTITATWISTGISSLQFFGPKSGCK